MNRVLMFVLGAAAGSLVTWKVIDKKYRQLAEDEIESVKEYYKSKENVLEVKASDEKIEKPFVNVRSEKYLGDLGREITDEEIEWLKSREEYKSNINDLGYSIDMEDPDTIVERGVDYIAPYVIAPEEFGEMDGYTTRSWTYYADFILTDEAGNIIFEPEKEIGDALEHFGEYEDDSIHVRNENKECDIEILKDEHTFTELNGEDS